MALETAAKWSNLAAPKTRPIASRIHCRLPLYTCLLGNADILTLHLFLEKLSWMEVVFWISSNMTLSVRHSMICVRIHCGMRFLQSFDLHPAFYWFPLRATRLVGHGFRRSIRGQSPFVHGYGQEVFLGYLRRINLRLTRLIYSSIGALRLAALLGIMVDLSAWSTQRTWGWWMASARDQFGNGNQCYLFLRGRLLLALLYINVLSGPSHPSQHALCLLAKCWIRGATEQCHGLMMLETIVVHSLVIAGTSTPIN